MDPHTHMAEDKVLGATDFDQLLAQYNLEHLSDAELSDPLEVPFDLEAEGYGDLNIHQTEEEVGGTLITDGDPVTSAGTHLHS